MSVVFQMPYSDKFDGNDYVMWNCESSQVPVRTGPGSANNWEPGFVHWVERSGRRYTAYYDVYCATWVQPAGGRT